jgi:signal transduction histidine kinase/FixJ family two-component response regulator
VLRAAGYIFEWRRVETEPDFLSELNRCPDIVLSDFSMPTFNGLRAAELMQQSGFEIPFILLSGTMGEELAVEAMKRGAADYLLKNRIDRLGDAVKRALDQKKIREEQRRTRAELVWKTAFLEAQVDSAPDGILVVDAHGKRILQNERLIQIFKIPDAILHDDNDAVMFDYAVHKVKNPDEWVRRTQDLYQNPDKVGRDEVELEDGTVLDRYSAPVRDRAGNYYGRIWTFRDITDRRRLEEQFRQSQKLEAIGLLAGGVAHDFNNLLSVIQGYCSMFEMKSVSPEEQHKYVVEIQLAGERAAALTRQLLTFSRRQPMQMRPVDLNSVVSKIARMLQRILGEDISLQVNYSSRALFLNADAGMLDQVLLNLAVNSRDAMPSGGQLIIETSSWDADKIFPAPVSPRTGRFGCLKVSDTGCGMSPELLSRIFEPFFTTKEVGRGTGLGLATVHGIVQQHHGWVDVKSEVGKGSAFSIYLPQLAHTPDQSATLGERVQVLGGTETILVVEDEATLRRLFRNMLARLGYQILEAPTGTAALEIWDHRQNEIQLLLTDLVMPDGMTGIDLGQKLLKDKAELPIIYISGYSRETLDSSVDLLEGINFLSKPFQLEKLAQIVRNSLDAARRPGR